MALIKWIGLAKVTASDKDSLGGAIGGNVNAIGIASNKDGKLNSV